ncbi:MAG TPA: hypothetical protein VG367_08040 [Mucilaginibacter sp.]|jgi:hypothetical protein|nr:hypothetical protein [Mucilaginibacter sp.]
MAETIEYPYSKNSATLGLLLPLIFFAITLNNFRFAWEHGEVFIWIAILLANIVFIFFFMYILFKRMIPALRNQVALELNEEGINDYQRGIIIEWRDVKDISQEYGRSYSKLVIDLKHETDYGTQVAISLRWVAGKDKEICETAMAYWEEMTGIS